MGSKMGILAYSRVHESEADKLGLILMAKAGYNPAEAVDFWQSMAQQSDKNVPVFFSTHPSDKQRVQDLKDFMPRAKQYKK
jgi:predicted Zn-dependent protease